MGAFVGKINTSQLMALGSILGVLGASLGVHVGLHVEYILASKLIRVIKFSLLFCIYYNSVYVPTYCAPVDKTAWLRSLDSGDYSCAGILPPQHNPAICMHPLKRALKRLQIPSWRAGRGRLFRTLHVVRCGRPRGRRGVLALRASPSSRR